ncbi:MAG: DUF3793 family protein [Clostridia bacterium]|nr:DUF3793 family protein [Clostridia bacterium]
MEKLIAFHCAPALAGIKTANMVSVDNKKYPDLIKDLTNLNNQLNKRGIKLEIICHCKRKTMVMVYRPLLLEKYIKSPEIKNFLKTEGYPVNGTLNENIEFLKTRLKSDEFPHEIGAFLGYPIEDIYGFINHKNEGLLLSGGWKVYANVNEAKKKFQRFSACRCALLNRITKGHTLAQIFCAA